MSVVGQNLRSRQRHLSSGSPSTADMPAVCAHSVQGHGGDQHIRVEHVHVNSGGQAVIGNIKNK